MEARIHDKRIILPIGTSIGFKMIGKNGQKISLKVTESEENSKFFALFDENDVDFEIEINNRKCIHGIGYTLIVNNGFYDYYIGAGELWSMEALYTKGRKLHFISQSSEKGQEVIQKTAEDYDITYSESAALCSRIEFNFEVEKPEEKPEPTVEPQMRGLAFDDNQSQHLESRSLSCLSHKKKKSDQIRSKFSSPLPAMSLGRDVPDMPSNEIVQSDSMVSQLDRRSSPLCGQSVLFGASPSPPTAFFSQSLAKVWNKDITKEKEKSNEKTNEPQIGDKGVVCFGEQSNQFYNPYKGFTKDKNLDIKPFVVELRFSKN